MKRKRGAPPGNQNAFRHGFYSARFKQRELRALTQGDDLELVDEVALMRVLTARLLDSIDLHKEPRDLQTELSVFRAFNLSMNSIRALIRTRLMVARDVWTPSYPPAHPDGGSLAVPDTRDALAGTTARA